ncbi:hypothetical protein K438DRAFT_1512031, partial [Mycena galopus ATCC 62051]
MRTHWVLYLQTIKDMYLGNNWQCKMIRQYELHWFRQKGHDSESPQAFIARRTMWTRMLVVTDNGGAGEVYHIMEKAPVSWGPILILENVRTTMNLYSKVVEHEHALVNAWRNEGGRGLNSENLLVTLKALGFTPDKPKFGERKHVHFSSAEESEVTEESPPVEEFAFGTTNEDEVVRQVYATLKERKRPPPPGGYPFPKEDGVVTKLGKLPPGPCRLCGSKKHWNRECPNYVVYSEGVKRNANLVSVTEASPEETMYQSAFSVLLNQALAKSAVSLGRMGEGLFFDEAALRNNSSERKTSKGPTKSGEEFSLEDEDEVTWREKPKATKGLLERVEEEEEDSDDEEETTNLSPDHDVGREACSAERAPAEAIESQIPGFNGIAATPDNPIRLFKRRRSKAGRSALGMSVLSMKGRVGSRDAPVIDLRLDT